MVILCTVLCQAHHIPINTLCLDSLVTYDAETRLRPLETRLKAIPFFR